MSTATAAPPTLLPMAAPAINPWVIAMTVTLATFMEVLDTSIANVALGHIAGNLGVSQDEATWVLTSYLVANAIVLPLSGWLSSIVGRKRFYMSCVFLFTVSSALCGMAQSLSQLIFFRILQGAGGGGLQPSEQGILLDTFPPQKRGMAMSIYAMAILVAPIMGPTLGGWITDNYNWRWIFLINIPVGCLSLFLSGIVLRDPAYLVEHRRAQRGKPLNIDFIGLGLLALGLGALEIIYDKGQEDDWFGSRFIVALMLIAGVCLTLAVFWELVHPNPIVNLRLLKDRNFAVSGLVVFCVFCVLYGSTVSLPQMLQTLFGYTAFKAGLVLSPGGVATMIALPFVGFAMGRRADARWLIAIGLVILGCASFWIATLNLEVAPVNIILPRCAQMLGLALIFSPINVAAYQYLPKDQINNATGLFNLIRNEGSSFGVAAVTTILARREQFHQTRLVEAINPFNPWYTERVNLLQQVFVAGGSDPVAANAQAIGVINNLMQRQAAGLSYFDVFWLFAMAAFCAVPLLFFMRSAVQEKGAALPH